MSFGKLSGGKKKTVSPSLSGGTFVGVDISDTSVKMVQISGRSPDKIKVENCAVTPLASGVISGGKLLKADDLVVSLQQTANRMGSVSRNVILGMPVSAVTLQNFAYDAGSGVDVESAAEFEAAQISGAVDDVNFDYQALSTGGMLLALAKKEDIGPFQAAMEEANLTPSIIDVESAACVNAFSYWINTRASELERSVIAIFDVGDEQTKALVVQSGSILYKQEFGLGGKHLSRDIQRIYQISAEEAEHMKLAPNKPGNFRDVANSFGSQIAQEIQRVLQFFYTLSTGGANVERLLLTGGGSLCEGIEQIVSSQTGIPTQLVHPFEHAPFSGRNNNEQVARNAARYTVALGLALRGLA